ncbi:MAG: transposase [Patescibacteria group bacterium]
MTQRRIYQEEYPYFVTFRTKEGLRLFEDEKYAELMARVMLKTSDLKRYDVLAWQIMPDHVHVLVFNKRAASIKSTALMTDATAPAAGCGVGDFNIPRAQPAVVARPSRIFTIPDLMHGIKSYFCDQLRIDHGIDFPFFQKRFYARIVNTDDYFRTVIEYIRHNPVKAELPKRYQTMPYQYFDRETIREIP